MPKCPMLLAAAVLLGTAAGAAAAEQAQVEAWRSRNVPTGPALVLTYERFLIQTPPSTLGLDPFYQKYVDAEGIPIVSSSKVPDAALLIARDIVNAALIERPDVRRELVRKGARVGIMAIDEGTMDLPEMRDWKKPAPDDPRLTRCEKQFYSQIAAMTDREYWNGRARGMGGTFTTGAAENILGTPGTKYFGENILLHEFSHNILSAVKTADPELYQRVQKAYDAAMEKGLWKYSYSAVTIQEYWAEGTQYWFNSNKVFKSNGVTVASDEDLRRYDPALYAVLGEVYGDRHHIKADVFYLHPARFNVPSIPKNGECRSMFGAVDALRMRVSG
ncbi:glycoside hydrolase [Pedomonas mirosovicensis]|uniref:glycoside hydrolase n=1 Tax=Pedomonas mirosovicensis TaxID=2908641 RepID=UPI002169BF44|nr:glycoside hydrolase [Pedomonas mirosovicensis]MCH8686654.1 glycoside hydrolase [Pedomonas mirosovicensis]